MKKERVKVYIVNSHVLSSKFFEVKPHYEVASVWYDTFEDVLISYPLTHYDLLVCTLPECMIPNLLLTPHFSLFELVTSGTYFELTNSYIVDGYQKYIPNLVRLASRLETIRCDYGNPITINSGFRNQALNNAVHGSSKSYHLIGSAADIRPTYIRDAYNFDHLLTAVKNSHPREFYANDARTYIHVAY